MDQNTAYCYEAINDYSYNELVAYAINLVADVFLYPSQRTIIIDGYAADVIGKFIDEQGLGFHIAPIELNDDNIDGITDPGALRKIIYRLHSQNSYMAKQHENVIAEITSIKNAVSDDLDLYKQMYREKSTSFDRVKGQVKAIALLMNEIFPEK